MKFINYSKLFVLSFILLIVGTCSIPLFQILINSLHTIFFVINFYFFYQLQFNLHIRLIEEIIPSLILFWLLVELIIQPGIVKLQFSKKFRIFIYTKIFKKEIGFITFNKKERSSKDFILERKRDKSPQKLFKITENQQISHVNRLHFIYLYHIQYFFYYVRLVFNKFKSVLSAFSNFLNYYFFKLNPFGRGNL